MCSSQIKYRLGNSLLETVLTVEELLCVLVAQIATLVALMGKTVTQITVTQMVLP